jgi:hypothetical protein
MVIRINLNHDKIFSHEIFKKNFCNEAEDGRKMRCHHETYTACPDFSEKFH